MDGLILVLTVLAGCLMPVQPAVNAVTARVTQPPRTTAWVRPSRRAIEPA